MPAYIYIGIWRVFGIPIAAILPLFIARVGAI